ncbi:MAG: hypothetical protein NTW86_32340 [Candidatus Sumerlaeota bacterium]|nr:hypothetical protein [Candidatus Sumerlaeota bacterium]
MKRSSSLFRRDVRIVGTPRSRKAARLLPRAAGILLACVAALAPAGARCQSSAPRQGACATNGRVYALARTPTTVYLGGLFTYVGPYTGGGAPISATTGKVVGIVSQVTGQVSACEPDGVGGWYIGGYITQVGSLARNNLAHILADGSVDPAWNPGPNNTVEALAVSGSTLYVGGNFSMIGGLARNHIAALDCSTGAATAWNPADPGGLVQAVAVSGSTVCIGGNFLGDCLYALDAVTGSYIPWGFGIMVNGTVWALAASGSTVYLGGVFTGVGGQTRLYIAALDAVTGAVAPFNPSADGLVSALAVSGSTVYAGGRFTDIGGQPRNLIAALDATTGLATGWNPNASSTRVNPCVYALAVSGSTVYAGGQFTTIGGQSRKCIASLDSATGLATAWDPSAGISSSVIVTDLAVSGSTVYAGGSFTSIGRVRRNRLAALDAATGQATDWNPNVTCVPDPATSVRSLAVSGSTLYAGGIFSAVGGQPRNCIAAVDLATGAATPWNPDANDAVYALAASGLTIYAGGYFSTIGGQARNRIAALDAATTTALAWNPDANGVVEALAVAPSRVYAGGEFTSIGGQTRNRIAALDATTGATLPWDPDSSGTVNVLSVSGSTVYAGGSFTSIGGQTRNAIAALDAATGLATAWNPNATGGAPSNYVFALALRGSTVYVGGEFSSIGAQPRNRIAALDAATGLATAWDPNAGSAVYALTASSGSAIHAGGAFQTICGQPHPYFAQFDLPASGAKYWRSFEGGRGPDR